jgi:hypothetical protein
MVVSSGSSTARLNTSEHLHVTSRSAHLDRRLSDVPADSDGQVVLSTEAFGGIGGRILAEQVANNGFTYTLNLTATNPSGVSQDHGKYILEVLETYNGYYIGLSVTREAINVLV